VRQGNCMRRDRGDEAARHADEGARSADLINGEMLSGRMLLGGTLPGETESRSRHVSHPTTASGVEVAQHP
jgi:hypothetical protein